jgi:hypothetical protein
MTPLSGYLPSLLATGVLERESDRVVGSTVRFEDRHVLVITSAGKRPV